MNGALSPETTLALMNGAQQSPAINSAMSANASRAQETAKEFEAVFISEMMKPMFEGIKTEDSLFGGGKGEEIFQSMMLQEYGKLVADRDVTGMQNAVKNYLIQMQADRTANEKPRSVENGTILELEILKEEYTNETAQAERL